MAVFEGVDMAQNALKSGSSIVKELCKEGFADEIDWIGVGIGINTGPVYIGSIGSETMKDYTVVGNTVNVSSRLCGYAKKLEVLFTESTLNSVRQEDFQYIQIGEKVFKGLSSPIKVFQLLI